MARKFAVAAVAWLGLFLADGAARGDVLSFTFGGQLGTSAHPSSWAPGTPFSGTVSFDPTQVIASTEANGVRDYQLGAGSITAEFQGRTLFFSTGPIDLKVPTSPLDPYLTISQSNPVNLLSASLTLQVSGDPASVFPPSGPPTSLDPNDFAAVNSFALSQGTLNGQSSLEFLGEVRSFQSVPEPASATCLCLIGVGWLSRRRR